MRGRVRSGISWCALALAGLAMLGCEAGADAGAAVPLRPRSQPIEYVGLKITREVDDAALEAFLDPLFGAAARAGRGHRDLELQPGLFLTVEKDPRTAEQAVVRLEMVADRPDADPKRRTILRVPVSYEYGETFARTVRTALATGRARWAKGPDEDAPFYLEYRVRSAQGGNLTVRVDFSEGRNRLTIGTEASHTSLAPGHVNQPAFEGDPYETIGGEVWFSLNGEQFDFFATRAYGLGQGAQQNFEDFWLRPHDWLHITVTPRVADRLVDVAFDVVLGDDTRLPLTVAPASYQAGEQFKQNVLRMVENMRRQEAERPGSSDAWEVPFHYDDPEGGGVVRVVARGEGGRFRIAYQVQSPAHFLRPLEFLPYQGRLDFPAEAPDDETASCAELGSADAPEGRFRVKFAASAVLRHNPFGDPLRGTIRGSVFRAADVRGTGPVEGARPVASFVFEDVDLTDPKKVRPVLIDRPLPAGEYQILGFMDTDGNVDPAKPRPESGDPVTVPIGSYPLRCADHPVTVEFAIPHP